MITTIALAVAMSAEAPSDTFQAGAWKAMCTQSKNAECVAYEAVLAGPVTLRLRRDATEITVTTEAEDCSAPSRPAFVNPSYSATTMKYLIRGHVVLALSSCKSKLPIPDIKTEELADLLRQTEGTNP
jgi:hypothetical protein